MLNPLEKYYIYTTHIIGCKKEDTTGNAKIGGSRASVLSLLRCFSYEGWLGDLSENKFIALYVMITKNKQCWLYSIAYLQSFPNQEGR